LIPSAYKISVSVGSYSLLDISTTCKHMKIPINLIEKKITQVLMQLRFVFIRPGGIKKFIAFGKKRIQKQIRKKERKCISVLL
jgi:hypothetical protein